jgi:pimeloyl-ACP methyl ester carboxylesterase
MKRALHLLRWLGPWANAKARPDGILRRKVQIDERLRGWLYLPLHRPVEGAWFVSHGLHYLGADDARLDRFMSVLASSGRAVFAPAVPDYMDLRVTARAIDDVQRAFACFLERPELPEGTKPFVWSVSFGSLLGLRLASAPAYADKVGGLMTFGGYADWTETIRFCLTGKVEGEPPRSQDPLNRPVIFLHMLPYMEDVPEDTRAMREAFHAFVRQTWSTQERPKQLQRYPEIARELARGLPEAQREIFLEGCGAVPGGHVRALDAIERSGDAFAHADPRPYLSGIKCPVHLVHSAGDDVIPSNQLQKLARAMPEGARVRTSLTGLYGHSSANALSWEAVKNVGRELTTMAQMLGGLSDLS